MRQRCAWSAFLRRPAVRQHAVFVEDYDMTVAKQLVQGVDLWIYTPRGPWEASGTSGMEDWLAHTRQQWERVRIAETRREQNGDRLRISAQVYLDGHDPDGIRVELYADPAEPGRDPERIPMHRGRALPAAGVAYAYEVDIPMRRPAEHYSVRVLPFHPEVRWPLETGLICWER